MPQHPQNDAPDGSDDDEQRRHAAERAAAVLLVDVGLSHPRLFQELRRKLDRLAGLDLGCDLFELLAAEDMRGIVAISLPGRPVDQHLQRPPPVGVGERFAGAGERIARFDERQRIDGSTRKDLDRAAHVAAA